MQARYYQYNNRVDVRQKHIYAQKHQLWYNYNNLRGHLENKFKTVNNIHLKHSWLPFSVYYFRLKIRLECSQKLTENDRKVSQNNFCSEVLFKIKSQNL